MNLILRIFMQINNIISFDELRTELRNSISDKDSKIKVENFVKFIVISDMLNLSFKNFLKEILEDVSYIKKETIPLATELRKALELKNFDDPDEIGRDYYDHLKQIEEIIKTNCGIDIDTEGYIIKDLYEDEEKVVYLDDIEEYYL